jgi:hypothetical protein
MRDLTGILELRSELIGLGKNSDVDFGILSVDKLDGS